MDNNISNIISSSNLHSTNFQNKYSNKKIYDIHSILQNNINNRNINNYEVNDKSSGIIYKNIINFTKDDTFIEELKSIIEKKGKIDYDIYNLVKGKFLSVIKKHKGSKLFQKYLKSNIPSKIIHLLYIELSQNLEEIITDAYSNYFCKKFYIFLSQKDRIDFLKRIKNSIFRLSCHNVGSFTIQAIIENLGSKAEQFIIINVLKNHIQQLSYDPFGCHVLERLLASIDEEFISFLYLYIIDNFLKLANNKYGIYLVKTILTFIQKKNLHEKIKKIVKENPYMLILNPFGNFVIQVIVEYWSDYKEIVNLYKGNFFGLSFEKYASNAIEKCIEKDKEILNDFIDEILRSNRIYDIMKSKYGNYVIQKAIKLSKNIYKKELVFCAAKDINNLNDHKLIIKWKSILLPYIKELTSEQIEQLKNRKYFEN